MRAKLDALYAEEVLPVFAAIGMGDEAQAYLKTVIERFSNPFLNHRLSEIFTNHEAKKRAPIWRPHRTRRDERREPQAAAPQGRARRRPLAWTLDPLAAGDLIAERRFAYAKAAAADGDLSAAAELFEQTLERAPNWAAAWFALGEAREKLGDLDAAARAFRETLAADPADAQGAAARLALIGRSDVARRAAASLCRAAVRRLCLALRQASHQKSRLSRPCPHRRRLERASRRAAASPRPSTSAAAPASWARRCGAASDHLTGVDLSAAMIAKARERNVYDELIIGDAVAPMRERPNAFDLIVAADVLVYVGDLAPLFAAVGTALTADGLFAFSVETCEGDGFKLEPTMRFAHSRSYVEATAREAGLRPLLIQSASTRRESGADAPGLICVFTGGASGRR